MVDYMNKPLISVTDGRRVGEIKDLYLDVHGRQVAAVLVGREGLINRKVTVVRRSDIQLYGRDAWLLRTSDDVAETLDEPPGDWLAVGDLRGREVATDGGTKLGAVGDVELDDRGNLAGLTLARVAVQGPLAESRRVPIEAVTRLAVERDEPVIVDLARAEAPLAAEPDRA
jgi:uncharacterized protein YrrD